MEMIKWGYVPKDSKTFECKNCGMYHISEVNDG